MDKSSSGMLLTENKDGSIIVGYVDYGVEFFGGRDYESFYELDRENADKLRAYFTDAGYANLKDGLIDKVGKNFNDSEFFKLCNTLGIKYKHTTWS